MARKSILTPEDREWLRDLARCIREAPREVRGIDTWLRLHEDIAEDWARRLEEMTGP